MSELDSEIKSKLLSSPEINDLIYNPLEYKVIQYGYVTKQGKIRKNWKKRFVLLLCAKIQNNANTEEKYPNEFIYQFKLLYFSDDTLSKLKGCVSFTNKDRVGLVAPKSALSMSKTSQSIIKSQCLSTPNTENSAIGNSLTFVPNTSLPPETTKFHQLMKKHMDSESHNSVGLSNIWSSFPNYNGFYIMDKTNNRIWLFDTQNFKTAKNWLKGIWNVEKYYYSNYEKAIKYKGFSGFVSCKVGSNSKQLQIETLKYMIIIPKKYFIKFKGILMFNCIENEIEAGDNKMIYEPIFDNNSLNKIKMRKQSLFIDDDDSNGSHFQLVGDLNKFFCNVRNDKSKMLWSIAMTHYQQNI